MPADFLSLYLPNLLLILSVFIVGAASPGPATLMIMNVSAREGRAAGVMLSLGIVTGSVFWACVAALGFVAALKTSILFFTAMKMAGGLYLLFLAFRAFRSASRKPAAGVTEATPVTISHSLQYLRGLLLHLTNPKAPLVWMATLSVGAATTAPPVFLFTAVALCALAGTGVFVGYACLFSTRSAVAAYRKMRRPFDLVIGTLFGAAGIKLLTLKSA
ncbi:LysE family translocator [Hyphomonas jannaschiana]|uniref:Putative amino-acid efflux transporter n=1 Tax=Hyphomonas jannaschiana VP2 TaxID=1280952 RepID=A0A059FDT6_9PROT|nr:LysE family transporter [Hyphomonas jannaschiana]KCZ88757.1 putative amino-acid efflux transporter [Hyphomonas jannaschiana VP2]